MPYLELRKARRDRTRTIRLNNELAVGRSRSNQVVLSDRTISRRHCAFTVESDGSVRVRDLNSRTGIRINGEKKAGAVLMPGDRVALGPYTLTLRLRVGEGSHPRAPRARTPGTFEVGATINPDHGDDAPRPVSARTSHTRKSTEPVTGTRRTNGASHPSASSLPPSTAEKPNPPEPPSSPPDQDTTRQPAPEPRIPHDAAAPGAPDPIHHELRQLREELAAIRNAIHTSAADRSRTGATTPAPNDEEKGDASSPNAAPDSPIDPPPEPTPAAASPSTTPMRPDDHATGSTCETDAGHDAHAADAAIKNRAHRDAGSRSGRENESSGPSDGADIPPERIFLANRRFWQRNPEDRDPWTWAVVGLSIALVIAILGATAWIVLR